MLKVEHRLRAVEDRVQPVRIDLGVITIPGDILASDWPTFIAGEMATRTELGQRGGYVILPEKGSRL